MLEGGLRVYRGGTSHASRLLEVELRVLQLNRSCRTTGDGVSGVSSVAFACAGWYHRRHRERAEGQFRPGPCYYNQSEIG